MFGLFYKIIIFTKGHIVEEQKKSFIITDKDILNMEKHLQTILQDYEKDRQLDLVINFYIFVKTSGICAMMNAIINSWITRCTYFLHCYFVHPCRLLV